MSNIKTKFAPWEVVTLGAVCAFKGGSGFKESFQGRDSGEHPFIKVSDLNLPGNEKYVLHSNNWVSAAELKLLKATLQPIGATVFAKVGAALKLNRRRVLVRPTVIDNNMMAAIPEETYLNREYLYYFLLGEDLGRFCQESAVPSINQGHLESIQIPLPSLAEQRKIAEILRTWDGAIETAEAELKVMQERKRWLMDKLLLGNWPKRTIEELFELEGSGIDKVILPDEQVVPLVNYMDAYRKRVLKHADVQAETSVSPNDLMRCQLKRGDIVLTPSSETPDDIAHSALINFEPGNAVHSYHLFRLRARSADEIVHDFRAFFLNHISVRRQFIRICSGTTRFTLTLPGVRAIKVSLPPITHQKYAAEVLNDATAQEELASQRVVALRTQKRGLMQKLLTGEVRVTA